MDLKVKLISGVKPYNVEVKSGTETTFSCEITGITSPVTVEWFQPSGSKVSDTTKGYYQDPGTLQGSSQTSTLKVTGITVAEGGLFTCRVKSGEYSESPSSDTEVNLNVYGKIRS